MKRFFVIFLCILGLGGVLYFRQNPKTRDTIQSNVEERISNTKLETEKHLLFPDLKIVPPKELYIFGTGENKMIRFSSTFSNIGEGPFEIIGHHEPDQSKTYATQYIKSSEGPGEYREVGTFVYHPEHKHWHIDKYVQYQLWSIKNGKQDQLVASTDKQSFCIWDEHIYDLTIPNAVKSRVYSSACSRNTQGMSIGWADTYLARVEGQELKIGNLPDGQYILTFTVNPDRKIFEIEYENNSDWLKIQITGSKLNNLGKSQ